MTRSVSHNRRPMNMPSSGVKLSCSGNGGGLGIRRSRRLRSSASFSSSLTPIVVLLMVIICCLQLVEYASSARSPKETEDDPITEQEEVPIKEQEEEVPITEQEEKVPIKEQEDVLKEEEEEEPVKVQYIKPVEPSEEVPEDHDKHRSKGGHQAPPPKQHKAAIAQETGTANATAAGEEHPSFKPPLKSRSSPSSPLSPLKSANYCREIPGGSEVRKSPAASTEKMERCTICILTAEPSRPGSCYSLVRHNGCLQFIPSSFWVFYTV
ncbi:hypothetical protein CBR_g51078 [Chara braunii]|uniref:Uncharacterized protein n=1 Tax=Chara braunii TaxID=69332 RepID=A0A388K6B1_CHABU|nr:hypothetical protein CBR_g51078 [Chara braunii]|eukprot:GBG65483.1 hypothetical protein CBR_g51078 [Chara braunii]